MAHLACDVRNGKSSLPMPLVVIRFLLHCKLLIIFNRLVSTNDQKQSPNIPQNDPKCIPLKKGTFLSIF